MSLFFLKTTFFNALNRLPDSLGYRIYHKIQLYLDKGLQSKIEPNQKSFDKVIEILNSKNFSLNGRNILEIGSGWMPIMPYFFKYFGNCDKVYSYDINQHYSKIYINELNQYYKSEFGKYVEVVKDQKYSLPDFVEYFPNQNVITAELPKKVDVVFSRFVLEHVTPQDMLEMHKRFASEYDENTLILHLISPSDHRAYSDKSLSHYDFLKYSRKEWDKIQTKFDYHNRMRLPQFLEIFIKAGMEVLHLEYDKVDKDSEKYRKFKALNLHNDFVKFSEEEILAGSINVLLRKKINNP